MPFIQDIIHKFEVAGGARYIRNASLILAALAFLGLYNLRCFKNMSTQEAMDSAQLARNIAEGKGYATLFVRPFSIYLVERVNKQNPTAPEAGKPVDFARLKSAHPDISNPPAYSVVLAGLMKALPFDFNVSKTKAFWSSDGRFVRYQPDFLIAIFNEVLLLGIAALAFFWARRVFDSRVAFTATILILGTEILWRFCVSGLSTILLMLIFMGLIWCLTVIESEGREPKWSAKGLFGLAVLTGVLAGMGGLTRYSFAWIILPVLAFLVLFAGPRRVPVCLLVLGGFLVVMMPWIIRNYAVSGAPFGTATYAALEGTGTFPGDRLERSLDPDLHVFTRLLWIKLMTNTRAILQNRLFDIGGGWIAALFLTGLLVGFRNPALRRIRYFLLLGLGLFVVVQAMGQTQLSEDSPGINSENLLILFAPLVIIYGVGLFFILLDQVQLPAAELRYAVIGIFAALVCLPMAFALLPPGSSPLAYPPYQPVLITENAALMKPNELIMSDIPWAIAWYGKRQSVWLTLYATRDPQDPGSRENFFSINDYLKPVNAVYLTPVTLDGRFASDWLRAGENSWGNLIVKGILQRKPIPEFPLKNSPGTLWPDQLLLTDWKRWQIGEQSSTSNP